MALHMDKSRIAELLEPYLGPDASRLKPETLANISTYIDILQHWNARINLTAIRDEDEIVTRHFGESFFAARHLFPREDREGHGLSRADSAAERARALAPEGRENASLGPSRASDQRPTTNDAVRLADVGSGAGFPGIPIKLWAPVISLTLIESNHKKAAFLKEVVRTLTLTDVDIQNARAESLIGSLFDIVTLRAVERFAEILPTAAGLVAPNGRLALLIGTAQLPEAKTFSPNLAWSTPIPLPRTQSRVLALACKL